MRGADHLLDELDELGEVDGHGEVAAVPQEGRHHVHRRHVPRPGVQLPTNQPPPRRAQGRRGAAGGEAQVSEGRRREQAGERDKGVVVQDIG